MTQPTVSTNVGMHRFRLSNFTALGPLIVLFLAVLIFSLRAPNFLSGNTLSLILQQTSYTAILAIGQTLIVLIAGIDLSVGLLMAFGGLVIAKSALSSGTTPVLAVALGLLATTFFGLLNGLITTYLSVPPFITTLGILGILQTLNQTYSGSQTVSGLPSGVTFLDTSFKVGSTAFTYGTVVMLVMYLITWFILSQTAPGRHIYAVGNNPEAARLSGISINRLTITIYAIAGFIYGIAALVLVARTGVGDPNAGSTDNLDTITAVVLGGTSLFGGRGNVLGTLLGAIIVGVLRSGLVQVGVSSIYQSAITGVLIIAAVALDQVSRRRT